MIHYKNIDYIIKYLQTSIGKIRADSSIIPSDYVVFVLYM